MPSTAQQGTKQLSAQSRIGPHRCGALTAASLAALLSLVGCGNFFTKETPSTSNPGAGTGPTSGVNRLYVMAASAGTISGFTIGTGTLTAVPGNPVAVHYAPLAAVITRNGKYLYVAGPGVINAYGLGTDGSLGAGAQAALAEVVSLDVSPDGQWLFGLDALSQVLDEWQINADGSLNTVTPVTFTPASGVFAPRMVKVAPSGGLIFAALGTAGTVIFTLNTTSGFASQSTSLPPVNSQTGDNAVAIDGASALLYLAESGASAGLAVFTIGQSGSLSEVAGSPSPIGGGASSIALEGTGKYVYVANRSDGTISGFSIAGGGALTGLTGSPFTAGSLVSSLGVDVTGKYLAAASFGGSPDLALYSIDTVIPGKLLSAATSSVGMSPTGASIVALTR